MRPLLCIIFLSFYPLVGIGEVEGEWTYITSYENGEATIKSSTAFGVVAIPSELGGHPVRKVGNRATVFGPGNTSVSSITIPNGVTTIGSYAFKDCLALTNVSMPNSVASIGANSFANCPALTNITIPNSVTKIEEKAFYCCTNLSTVIIGSGLTSIESDALGGCGGLTSIILADGLAAIGSSWFANLSITTITIPNSVKSIGIYAFKNCLP